MKRETIINIVAIVVCIVWAASIVATLLDHTYQPPATVHLIMMAVIGALTGFKVAGKIEREDKNGQSK